MKLFLSTETYDPVSAIIRWNTRCPWSHTGFLREDGATFSAMIAGGVKWRPPFKHAIGITLEAPGTDEAFAWALTQEGKKYDWRAICGIAVDREWGNRDRWFCSELVAAAFNSIGQPLLNVDAPVLRITPRDLTLSTLVSLNRTFNFAEFR